MEHQNRVALVMEGGSMRGIFTCGIIDVFLEKNIPIDGAVGVSAGACFGVNIKSKQYGRGLRYNKKYTKDPRYASWRNWITTGNVFDEKFCYHELIYQHDLWDEEAFANNPMDFYVVTTNVETGKAVYHKCSDGGPKDIQWVRASASMPIFSKPVHLQGGIFLDGGISDSIPLKFMQHKGYDKYIVIETQPIDYVKEKNNYMPIVKLSLKKYPKMIEAMANRHIMYNAQKKYVRDLEVQGKIFVFRPDVPLGIKAFGNEPEELQRVYDLGRKMALERLEDLKEYLK